MPQDEQRSLTPKVSSHRSPNPPPVTGILGVILAAAAVVALFLILRWFLR